MAALATSSSTPLAAAPVVDQAFTQGSNLTAVLSEGCRYVGQSFTAGITGRLTGVNVDVETFVYSGVHPMRVAIRSVSHGRPTGEALGYRYLYADLQAPLTRLITFPQHIPVVAGRRYAVVLSYRGAPLGGADVRGQWRGATDDLYPRGRMLFGDCPSYGGTRFWVQVQGSEGFDLHFRTYVNPS